MKESTQMWIIMSGVFVFGLFIGIVAFGSDNKDCSICQVCQVCEECQICKTCQTCEDCSIVKSQLTYCQSNLKDIQDAWYAYEDAMNDYCELDPYNLICISLGK